MKKNFIISLLIALSVSFAWLFLGKPIPPKYPMREIFSFHEAEAVLEKVDGGTVVLFDVDGTLITARDYFPRWKYFPLWFRKLLYWKFDQMKDLSFEKEMIDLIYRDAPRVLIEPDVVGTINLLSKRGVSVLALTKFITGGSCVISSLPEWRFEMLRDMGINFSRKFEDRIFDQFSVYKGNFPLLLKGILFTHNQGKDVLLKAFLDGFGLKPHEIVFFDDHVEQLQLVGKACEELEIPCFLFHYRGGERIFAEWNTRRVIKQFDYLIKERKWLSDDEADNLLWHFRLRDFLFFKRS